MTQIAENFGLRRKAAMASYRICPKYCSVTLFSLPLKKVHLFSQGILTEEEDSIPLISLFKTVKFRRGQLCLAFFPFSQTFLILDLLRTKKSVLEKNQIIPGYWTKHWRKYRSLSSIFGGKNLIKLLKELARYSIVAYKYKVGAGPISFGMRSETFFIGIDANCQGK